MSTVPPHPRYPEPLPYGGQLDVAAAARTAAPEGAATTAHRAQVAPWGSRVAAYLVDWLVTLSPGLVVGPVAFLTADRGTDIFGEPTIMTTPTGDWAILAGLVVASGLWVWNRWLRQGRTGRSLGKQLLRTRLVDARTGAVTGVGRAAGRELAHVLDWPASLGYLWAIWDPRGQTFADKVVTTVVVRDPRS
nr:RDD family protein [uncultured Actinotalea sp.]